MQKSNRVAALSRASFLAACLVVSGVQSESTFLENRVARLLADTGLELKVDAAAFNRKLDQAGDILTDDFLNLILGDEELMQCSQDVDEMMFANPALGDAVTEFDNSAVITPSFVGETVTMDMMYPEESMLALEQACSDAGGYYEELVGVLSCKFDDGAGGAVAMNMNNFASCSADTAACESVDIMEFMGQLLMSMGGTCDLPDMMKPDGEKPVAEEPVAEEPVADETPTADEPAETEESSSTADTSAGARRQWALVYLSLAGMIAGLSFF